jgi:hypothetical protein
MRNRVTPFGEIIDVPDRGLVYGNRGCLHRPDGTLVRNAQVQRWIACRLEFKGRRRELLQPGRYTELFFLDEATAFAAGHRPCAECRREDYNRYMALAGARRADEIDARLAGERGRTHPEPYADLPDGAMADDAGAWLVRDATVLTPPTTLAVLRAGWDDALVPLIHPTA